MPHLAFCLREYLKEIITYKLLFYLINILSRRNQSMGCTDSQLSSNAEKHTSQAKGQKNLRFAQTVEDDTIHPEQPKEKAGKIASRSLSKNKDKSLVQAPENIDNLQQANKQNTLKVKKARYLRHHPQHQKFIGDIMQQSRNKVINEHPDIPKTNSDFIKPVIQYPNSGRGQILPNQAKLKEKDRWNLPISEQTPRDTGLQINSSYVAINQATKSPYKKKQIQRRLNELRNESIQREGDSKSPNKRDGTVPRESMQTVYL